MTLLFDYFFIGLLMALGLILSCLLVCLPWLLSPQETNTEKLSVYECGFDPFESARIKFDIQFYILAILFIIFDIELVYFIPWVLMLTELGVFAYGIILSFFLVIVLGFYYEWLKNALEWN